MMNGCPRWSILALPLLAALGCSDPVPRPAQGNLTLSIQPPIGSGMGNCPVPGNTYVIAPSPTAGPNKTDPGKRIIDGEQATNVSCSVQGSSTYTFSGSIKGLTSSVPSEKVSLTIPSGTINMDMLTGTASVIVNTTGLGGNFQSAAGACSVNVVQVRAGMIWASISCPVISDPTSVGRGCSVGPITTFVLENCQGT